MADASALRARVVRYGESVVQRTGELMQNELRVAAPLGQTGATVRGVTVEFVGGGTRPGLVAKSTGKGGDFVESGTRAHIIVPVSAKALRFLAGGRRISQFSPNQRIATRGGGVVYAKVVHHPGTPPRPWFRPVVERFAEFLARAAAVVRG